MQSNVIAQVLGGQKRILDGVATVRDCRSKLGLGNNYTASVNGTPASDTDLVRAQDFVSFSESVKGAI